VRFKQFLKGPHEVVCGADDIKEGLLLEGVERLGLVDFLEKFSAHEVTIGGARGGSKGVLRLAGES